MKITPIYFKEFKSKTIDELVSFAERYDGYDLIILIRTKYSEMDEWVYEFQILHSCSWNAFPFEWESDWYEGQEYIEYCGGAVIDYYINLEGIQ